MLAMLFLAFLRMLGYSGALPRSFRVVATTIYREMDMQFWLEKAEAEMAALD